MDTSDSDVPEQPWLSRVASGYRRLTAPSRMSLPRQVAAGLAGYAAVFVALVALRINGSSMGLVYSQFFAGKDPRLLLGTARAIRSDEWLVTNPLVISQVQQGLPRTGRLFPGGFDASIVWDLPTRDWSVIFRPHELAFFAMPLDYAYAFRWWLPLFVTAAVVFVFACVLWRRAVASWLVAVAFVVSPFFQWWFGAGSFWPPAAAVAVCLAVIVLLRSNRRWLRWTVAAVTGYLVAVAVVALYPPYLIPCFYPAVAFCAGWFATKGSSDLPRRQRWPRLIPLGVAAFAVVVVAGAFLLSHRATVQAETATVYPGQRLRETGLGATFPGTSLYSGVFASALRAASVTGFAGNASEGAGFIFLGLYLVGTACWVVWRRWRRLHEVDWAIVGTLASLVLLLAYTYLPGWDALAHLLLLDRVEIPRVVIGFGTISVVLLVLVVGRLREGNLGRVPWWTTAIAALLVVGNHVVIWSVVRHSAPQVLVTAIWWLPMIVLLTVAAAMFTRGRATLPAALTAVVALVVAGWVNPMYQGVLDLRTTDIGQAIAQTERDDPGTWVTVGGWGAVSVLREEGVEAFSGVQGVPSAEMWAELDPDNSERNTWDRYAHVNWVADLGAPEIALAHLDVVQVRLDSCSEFAQHHLNHVLAQGNPIDQSCLSLRRTVQQGGTAYYIYDVVPRR